MPETYTESAVILNRRPWRAYDYTVSAYTRRHGKIQVLARGALRPQSRLAAHLEPLNLVEMMVVNGRRIFIGGAVSRNCYTHCKADIDKILVATSALRQCNTWLRVAEPDSTIFFLITDFLQILNEQRSEVTWYEFVRKVFLYKILVQLGYKLNLETCASCNQAITGESYFLATDQGVRCRKCVVGKTSIPLSHQVREKLQGYSQQPLSVLITQPTSRTGLTAVSTVLEVWIRYLDEELRAAYS